MIAENHAPTEIRSLDRPTRSQSLYRLRYPGTYYDAVTAIMMVSDKSEWTWEIPNDSILRIYFQGFEVGTL
jgi:hypothetical protein